MSIVSLIESEKTVELEELIAVCKSMSQINGIKLRDSHYKLGKLLCNKMLKEIHYDEFTIIIMMRAGLCFGLGIADELELK
jgi:hypothetical protein